MGSKNYKALVFLLFVLSSKLVFGQLSGQRVVDLQGTGDYNAIDVALNDVVTNGIDGKFTILIKEGTYTGKFDLQQFSKTSPSDSLIIKSYPGNSNNPLISIAGDANNTFVLRLSGVNNIVIESIDFENTGDPYGTSLEIGSNVSNLMLKDCDFSAMANVNSFNIVCPAATQNVNNVFINNCSFAGGNGGLAFNQTSFNNIRNVTIQDSYFESYEYISVYLSFVRGGKIDNCEFKNPSASAKTIILSNTDSLFFIGNNIITGSNTNAIMINNHKRGVNFQYSYLYNNVVYGVSGALLTVDGSNYFKIYHNSFYKGSTNTISMLEFKNGCDSIWFKNNLGISKSNGALMLYETSNINASMKFDENIYYAPLGNLFKYGSLIKNLSEFKTATNIETNTIVTNPNTQNSPGNYLKLTCNSPKALKASWLPPESFMALDYDGNTRSNTPWRGAYSFRTEDTDALVVSGYVTDGTDTLKSGKMHFIVDKDKGKQLLDTLESIDINPDGSYVFNNVFGYKFYINVDPDKTNAPNYVKAYQDKSTLWENVSIHKATSCNYKFNVPPLKLTPQASGANSISGKILMDVTGKTTNPIPGLDVVLDKIPPGNTIIAKTTTDANGNYTFANLGDGTYNVLVDISGLGLTSVHSTSVSGGQTVSDLDYCADTSSAINMCSAPTGINERNSNSLNVFPNPTNGELNIVNLNEGSKIRLLTLEGKFLFEETVDQSSYMIDLTGLKGGLYFLEVLYSGEKKLVKIVHK